MTDDEHEGILWLKFSPKFDDGTSFCFCACYLLSIESTRAIDGNDCFDRLLYQIHIYGKMTVSSCVEISTRDVLRCMTT